MKYIFCIVICSLIIGCSTSKPPLETTQIVDGKSIVKPPEFYVLPKIQTQPHFLPFFAFLENFQNLPVSFRIFIASAQLYINTSVANT